MINLMKQLLVFFVRTFFSIYFSIKGKPVHNSRIRKVLKLYEKKGEFSELFSLIRVWDAPFELIESLVPDKGIVLDLGCGDGFLANYIALSGSKRKVLGIEINRDRIKEANKGIENVKFLKSNILREKIPRVDTILIIDVLHHLPSRKDQELLLARCVKSLKKGGKLIIVEVSEKPFLKYIFGWMTDAIIVPILFEKKLYDLSFIYRKVGQWLAVFEKLGLRCRIIPAHQEKPFSHVVFECRQV